MTGVCIMGAMREDRTKIHILIAMAVYKCMKEQYWKP